MKGIKAVAIILISLTITFCTSDDAEYPQTVNIKFEVITSRNSEAIIKTTINKRYKY